MYPALTYIYARLSEPSTWRGLIALVTAADVALSPDQADKIVAAGLALIGLIGAFMPDKLKLAVGSIARLSIQTLLQCPPLRGRQIFQDLVHVHLLENVLFSHLLNDLLLADLLYQTVESHKVHNRPEIALPGLAFRSCHGLYLLPRRRMQGSEHASIDRNSFRGCDNELTNRDFLLDRLPRQDPQRQTVFVRARSATLTNKHGWPSSVLFHTPSPIRSRPAR
jgi:hypothetical protein